VLLLLLLGSVVAVGTCPGLQQAAQYTASALCSFALPGAVTLGNMAACAGLLHSLQGRLIWPRVLLIDGDAFGIVV
jgi:hypothetical protein